MKPSASCATAKTPALRSESRRRASPGTKARASSFAAYKGGVSSLIDVLDVDRRLLETRDAEIQAKSAAARAAVASFRALGGGWDAPRADGKPLT